MRSVLQDVCGTALEFVVRPHPYLPTGYNNGAYFIQVREKT